MKRLQQGLVTGEMGLGVRLHNTNLEPPMSALGQKATFGAFSPCPLFTQKQTSGAHYAMSV
jgi:hypothetical protein